MLLAAFVKSIDHPAPGLALAVVDLAEIKHRPLYHPTTAAALALDNAPVTVLLAVLTSSRESQIHERRFYSDQNAAKGGRSSLQRFSMPPSLVMIQLLSPRDIENREKRAPVGKVGLSTPAHDIL